SMVETYLKMRSNLKAVVVILDIRRDLSNGDRDLVNWLNRYGIESIIVLTKADKLSRNKAMSRAKSIGNDLEKLSSERSIVFSAKTRAGRKEIWERIENAIP
ncbi:MAG: YihA family ribosome biogenesis GTP-binding protein, partial [Deltaproteobacteria bacterium]|nr:YihA family ribosome biogenesis GTP-binding protein [Deltaproteobacteria bacterium]